MIPMTLSPAGARRSSLLLVVFLALAALPRELFPPQWLATFLLPAGVLLPVLERTKLGRRRALVVTGIAQLAALFVVRFVLPLPALAALGCTLIPPAVYSAVRARPIDSLRAIFLAFCILLVAAILGHPPFLILIGFLVAAVGGLSVDVRSTARERRVSFRGAEAPAWRSSATAAQLMVGAVLVCLSVFRGLGALPDPVRGKPSSDARTQHGGGGASDRVAGPSRSFAFDGAAGSPIALRADRLLTVRSQDGHPVPADLYLRSGAFEIAGLDRWLEGSWRARSLGPTGRVGKAFDQLPERQVRVVSDVATDLAFVPAGTFELIGADRLVGSAARGTFRHARPAVGATFEARFHNLHYAELEALPSPGSDGLLQIPPEVERERDVFAWILRDDRVRHAVEPLRVAEAVATVIRSRCSYALAEPTGPHGHAVLDFLDGDHRGFCMHFASAEALALRMLGVPCRIGVGLYGGDEYDGLPNSRVFGSHHAHAWVEIPIEGAGWVVVDPTPPSIREFLRWPELAPRETVEPQPAATELAEPEDEPAFDAAIDPRWLALLAGSLLFLGLGFRRSNDPRGGIERVIVTDDMRDARKLMARVLAAHAKAGNPRLRGEGLESWSSRVAHGSSTLTTAVRAFQEVRFGGRPLDRMRREALELAIETSTDDVEGRLDRAQGAIEDVDALDP